jgi:hypothetical protein
MEVVISYYKGYPHKTTMKYVYRDDVVEKLVAEMDKKLASTSTQESSKKSNNK